MRKYRKGREVMATRNDDTGVLLLNLGGPETLAEVRPFLYRLFSDPEIIHIKNKPGRCLLARFISGVRAGKSRRLYRQIGGGSPLRRITEAQGAALATELGTRHTPARVYVGMLCWRPFIADALRRIVADGIRRLVVLPLFPQYSGTTTGACFRRLRALTAAARLPESMEFFWIEDWHDHPRYLSTMTDLLAADLARFSPAPAPPHILYSAHSLPQKYVTAGDPYPERIRRSVALLHERLSGQTGVYHDFSLAFQSKVGPVKWLEPALESVLRRLAEQGVRQVLAVPVSFVSDHIETLQELDIACRQLATRLGITEFKRAATPNLHPQFIAALADLVQDALFKIPSAATR